MTFLDIREATVSVAGAMRNANIAFDQMTASAVAILVETPDGVQIGYGFDSIGRYGHGALMRERFIPRLINANLGDLLDGAGLIDPVACWHIMMTNEKQGGHGERAGAVGVIDMALWDVRAKQMNVPAWQCIAQYFGLETQSTGVAVYASGGHYHAGDPVKGLTEELRAILDHGVKRVKIKIGGAPLSDDIKRIEAALSLLGNERSLAVDANGIWDLPTATEWMSALSAYNLAWIEEPAPPLDFDTHHTLAGQFETPIATGENLFSFDDARNLLRYSGLRPDRDILQFDISLSYGIPEYVRILKMAEEEGWRATRFCPHAGHALALHCAAAFGLGGHETSFSAGMLSGGLPEGLTVQDGIVPLPQNLGFGVETLPGMQPILEKLVG